jgi:hypothetical protein
LDSSTGFDLLDEFASTGSEPGSCAGPVQTQDAATSDFFETSVLDSQLPQNTLVLHFRHQWICHC